MNMYDDVLRQRGLRVAFDQAADDAGKLRAALKSNSDEIAQAIREAVAEEREACARLADEMDSGMESVDIGVGTLHNPRDEAAREIAAAIRARANVEQAR
jgi:deoxyribodipyrimidine photolyase-like uncharacterized protein